MSENRNKKERELVSENREINQSSNMSEKTHRDNRDKKQNEKVKRRYRDN